MEHKNAISRAAEAVGGQSALAKKLGCTPQAVQRMCSLGRVAAERVLTIERFSGVPRYELRPDLYPPPAKTRKAVSATSEQSAA